MNPESVLYMYQHLSRESQIDELNRLTDRKWDLLDQIAAIDLGRAALYSLIREIPDQRTQQQVESTEQ